ncbi:MAG: xylulokinase [Kiritimatiellae bacterium]|nr:xylulokinase [Kiritimatiellia bacterium]
MKAELAIGLDNGTQGTKCVVYDPEARRVLASAYAPHSLIENDAGRREQEPREWIEAATKVLRQCLSAKGVKPGRVAAIGVSGQQHGCVALDKDGAVLRPAKLWCDTETVEECDIITARAGGRERVVAAIGNSVAAGFTASKVLWLKRHEPALYERLATVLLPHDYLNFWLTGERRTEAGDASGTAYFDVRRRCWSEELLRAIEPDGRLTGCLPEVIASDEVIGTLRPELAREFGLPADVIVATGGGDNMMAAIGTGNVTPGVVTASLGTSGTIYAHADRPIVDPSGELAAFCSSTGGWLPLVCTMNVTVATEQARQLLGLGLAEFDAEVAKAPAGAEGLLLLPYFNGERTPPLPRARASFSGLSSANCTRPNFCRAAMEGATLGLRYGLEVLRRQGIEANEIRLVGGGAKSAIWRRIVAGVFGTTVVCPAAPEAGAMGAAIQALWCLAKRNGHPVPLADLTARHVTLDETTRVAPDAGEARRYNEIYARYLQLNDALAPLSR